MSLYDDASLIMFPSGYKEDKIYSLKPTDGSGDLTFTRASTATRVNADGLIETSPVNLATNSENFSSWTLAAVTVTANDITAPNGTLTADKLTISSNGNDVKQTISVMPNSVYTWTFYVYGGTATGQQMRFYDNTNSTNIEYYIYSSSVVLGAWVKIERTFTTPSGCYEIQAWVLAATSTIGTMWVWGAQLNIGATAKPYFPTTDRLDVPRIDYTGGGCGKLLLEPQRTNLVTYSEQFDNAAYIKTDVAITANNTTSPDGTQNADLFTTNNAAGTVYRVYNSSIGGTDTTNTISAFFKYGNHPYVFLVGDSVGAGKFGIFNIQNGTIENTSAGYTATITNYGNGWYRCTLTGTMDSTNNIQFGLTASTSAYAGTSLADGKTMYCWGAQREYNASYPTSYIPTLASSVTRVGDDCGTTSLQSASLIGATAGTFFLQTTKTNNAVWINQRIFLTSTTVRSLLLDTSGGQIRLRTWDAASAGATITTSGLANGLVKYLIKWDGTNIKVFANGVLQGSSAQPSYAYTTYKALESTAFSNNTISQLLFFPTALSDAEAIALTTL